MLRPANGHYALGYQERQCCRSTDFQKVAAIGVQRCNAFHRLAKPALNRTGTRRSMTACVFALDPRPTIVTIKLVRKIDLTVKGRSHENGIDKVFVAIEESIGCCPKKNKEFFGDTDNLK